MAKTSMNIRIEPKLKKEVEEVLTDLGLTISEAVTIYLKQIVFTNSIPLEIKRPKYSKDFLEAIAEAEEMEKHPEKYKSFETVEEFMEDLHNEIQN